MSDNIPFEIQMEIIKHVHPVRSLIRFTSVSKKWKSLIESSEFIADHSVNQTKPHHLLVMNKVDSYSEAKSEYRFVSIVDDDSFPQHKFSHCVPTEIKLVTEALLFDSSHGLVCLYGYHGSREDRLVVLWNPSIRKSIGILLNDTLGSSDDCAVGFGVCPQTSDTKIVHITRASSSMDWHAEVFTLSSGAWRSIPVNLPLSINFYEYVYTDQVVIDGVIHWRAYENITKYTRIITFDLTSEEFGVVQLPDSFKSCKYLAISKFKESLVVAKYLEEDFNAPILDVWMTNADLKTLFTKLYSSVKEAADSDRFKIIGFRKNGEPITEHIYDIGYDRLSLQLLTFDPCSKQFNGLYNAFDSSFKTTSYSESLLLLNYHD